MLSVEQSQTSQAMPSNEVKSVFGSAVATRPLAPLEARRFRFDRAVTLGIANPVRSLIQPKQPRIPVLMYHGIREGVAAVHPYFETNTSPEMFRRQMQFLRDNGYTTIDLGDAATAIATGQDLTKRFAITFDDGFRDFYTNALPVLADCGFTATMFVVSRFTCDQGSRAGENEFMTWSEVRETRSQGTTIGSHSASHPELHGMNRLQVTNELRESKQVIEQKLGASVSSFAYPYAFPEQDKAFVGMMRDILQAEGYQYGVCTIIGTAQRGDDSFFLPRIPVNSYDDLLFFEAKLNGAYDWLHAVQYARKRLKSVI